MGRKTAGRNTTGRTSLFLAAASLLLMGMSLPENGPRPPQKPQAPDEAVTAVPDPAGNAAPPATGAAAAEAAQDAATTKAGTPAKNVAIPGIPVPTEKPDDAGLARKSGEGGERSPDGASTSEPGKAAPTGTAPSNGKAAAAEDKPDGGQQPDTKSDPATDKDATEPTKDASPAPPPIVKEDPEALQACLSELTSLGAEFKTLPEVKDDENGCGIEKPIALSQVLPGIPLADQSPMRCEAALSLARWMKGTVEPSLKLALPERRIIGIDNASSYACRLRNHAETGKISEHARGNAIDIGGFKLDNGDTIAMTPKEEDSTLTGAFQRTATAGACLYFTTVLSPGSDATHQDHLHLDVLERKGGYRYCR
ncbi:extensin family protein [Rhizobium sp. SGZ-381]|uniref:extensin-like domain-containing protein n=1 Tax=Rhizobium sp. SGZ-381 TaxID=3342800 RepID=UPI00366FB0C3